MCDNPNCKCGHSHEEGHVCKCKKEKIITEAPEGFVEAMDFGVKAMYFDGENPFGDDAKPIMKHAFQRCDIDKACQLLDCAEVMVDRMTGRMITMYDPSTAMVNDVDGNISFSKENTISGRFIHGMAIGSANTLPAKTVVAFTENNGYRNVGLSEEGLVCDIGPIVAPTIVGTAAEPTAIIIPLKNVEALERGAEFCASIADKITNTLVVLNSEIVGKEIETHEESKDMAIRRRKPGRFK